MSELYCPFGCEFEKPLYGANGYDWWVPLCPECEAPLKVRQPTQRVADKWVGVLYCKHGYAYDCPEECKDVCKSPTHR